MFSFDGFHTFLASLDSDRIFCKELEKSRLPGVDIISIAVT